MKTLWHHWKARSSCENLRSTFRLPTSWCLQTGCNEWGADLTEKQKAYPALSSIFTLMGTMIYKQIYTLIFKLANGWTESFLRLNSKKARGQFLINPYTIRHLNCRSTPTPPVKDSSRHSNGIHFRLFDCSKNIHNFYVVKLLLILILICTFTKIHVVGWPKAPFCNLCKLL